MIKSCSKCETVVDGTEEEVKEKFRFMKRDNCFRSICKKCEYKSWKDRYYIKPSLRRGNIKEYQEYN